MTAVAQFLAHEHDKALERHQGHASLAAALVRAAKLAPAGAKVWLASDIEAITADDEPALIRLSRRRRVTLLVPLDTSETAPPARALPVRCGPSSRFARLRPVDTAELGARLRAMNVTLEVIPDDPG